VEIEETLLRIEDRERVASLVEILEFDESESGMSCFCCGNPTLEFYKGDALLLSLGYHHSRSLRWVDGQWPGDGLLKKASAHKLVDWFEQQGVHGPKQEYDEGLESERLSEVARAKWLRAMPVSLRSFWLNGDLSRRSDKNQASKLRSGLIEEFPVEQERIIALFAWYGCGEGPWSPCPVYELAAEVLLLEEKTSSLLDALRGRQLTTEQTEGVARLFGAGAFSEARPGDLKLLTLDLRQKLLDHCLGSGDEDKCARALMAFRQQTSHPNRALHVAAKLSAAIGIGVTVALAIAFLREVLSKTF
jgi:hypothetical protein